MIWIEDVVELEQTHGDCFRNGYKNWIGPIRAGPVTGAFRQEAFPAAQVAKVIRGNCTAIGTIFSPLEELQP